MDTTTQPEDGDDERAGDLLVGANAIRAHLVARGMPETTDPYYLRRVGWPIGKTADNGGSLIASKRRLDRHTDKITRGPSAA
jgi:hypothetical protein